ncbi:MAG TPA: hypothetical protein VEQ58_11285 [Polyangiaceae bacterium]|nr:hypothetical protein [Polyangiaceae bacterium]
MTQLALLLALGLLGLVLSFAFGRLEVKRSAVSATVKRAEGALERASLSVLRLGAWRGLTLLAVPAVGLGAFALLAEPGRAVSNIGRAVFLVLALLGGAAATLLHARFALGLGTRAASSAAAALARGSALSLRPLLRASVAIAVFGEGLGLLGLAAAFATLYAVRGGFAGSEPNAQLAVAVVELLPAFALGAAIAALALAREGSVAASAARVGGSQSVEIEAGDPRDPALLAELMGHLVGELLPRALTSFVCGTTLTVSTALLAATESHPAVGTLSSLVLVALVRSFGGLGSICGVLGARVTDDEAPALALWRGLSSSFVVALFGLGAALFWLERPYWGPLFAAGALGLLTMTIVAQVAWLPLRRSGVGNRELLDARGSGDAATIVRSAGASLASWWPALLVPPLVLAGLERALSHAAPASLLLLTFVAGALSLGPFALSMSGFGLLTTHARGVAALARLDVEPSRRSSKLDDASALGAIAGSTHASLALALSALVGLLSLGGGSARSEGSIGPAALATTLGVALVLVFGARAAQSAVSGARLVALEVERQLRELPRSQGVLSVPADFTPSYKACVDAAFSAARGASVVELCALLLAPFLLGSALHWGVAAASETALAGFGIASVMAGLILTLGGRATRAMLGEVRRRLRGHDGAASPASTSQAQSFGDLVGVTAASSAEALSLVLALTVLCLAPLLR